MSKEQCIKRRAGQRHEMMAFLCSKFSASRRTEQLTKTNLTLSFEPFREWFARFHLFIEQINGCKNVFTDELSRWAIGHRTKKVVLGKITALYLDFVLSSEELSIMKIEKI